MTLPLADRRELRIALTQAVKARDQPKAQELARALLDSADERQSVWTLLSRSARESCLAPTDEERRDAQGVLDALLAAARPERFELVQAIIENGLLKSAAHEQGLAAIQSLLAFGPRVWALDRSDVLFDAIADDSDPQILAALLEAGLNPDGAEDSCPPLHAACSANREDLAALLLAAGADPDARSPTGWLADERAPGEPLSGCDLMIRAERERRALALSTPTPAPSPKPKSL